MSVTIKKQKIIVGIDEVGRGPLAGPVTVGVCCIFKPNQTIRFKNFKDSKKLSEKQREEWYARIMCACDEGILSVSVMNIRERIIDAKGLSYAISQALEKSLKNVAIIPRDVKVLLDGGLKAPPEFIDQKTIIKGDEKELAIALASIVAKVTRDRYMIRIAKKYPQYGFEQHKGYGTERHYTALKKYGISPIHRRLFLRKFMAKK